jgi:hypothetical protein
MLLIRDLLYDLLNARIIIETLTPEVREVAYQPALDPAKITVSYVVDTLDKQGQQVSFEKESKELINLTQVVESFYQDIRNSDNNKAINDL